MSTDPHVFINMTERGTSNNAVNHNKNTNNIHNNNHVIRRRDVNNDNPDNQKIINTDVHLQRKQRDLTSATNDAEPLLEHGIHQNGLPPLAGPENGDESQDDDNNVQTNTLDNHPGVDDGFFSVGPRVGEDEPDATDDKHLNVPTNIPRDNPKLNPGTNVQPMAPRRPSVSLDFPYAPGFGPGIIADANGNPMVVPDVNVYQHKKTLAQGMMDLALLSANANQLRYVLESYSRHPYYYFSLVFISLSLIIQILVGVGLIMNSRYDVKNEQEICKADRINNLTIIGIFLITIVNVFISSFGVADPPADMRN